MEAAKHLKTKQEYSDLYDRRTVVGCRELIALHAKQDKKPPLLNGKKPPKGWVDTASKMALEFILMFEKGGRYLQKEKMIARWMTDDQEKDRFYASAEPMDGVRCLKCRTVMNLIHKDLWTELNKSHRVLFMFDCTNGCLPRRAFWNNGDEWGPQPNPCPKCKMELASKHKREKYKIFTIFTCAQCGYRGVDEMDLRPKEEKHDHDFETDRAKFCLTQEEGEKWRRELANMEEMKKLVDEITEREKNKELYDRVAKVKKLTVLELERFLQPVFEKGGYINMRFANPEIDRIVTVPFMVQDAKSARESRASEYDLKRLLKKTLEDTNWRLMSDGVSYRLGIISGRLRGYESEKDLVGLVKDK